MKSTLIVLLFGLLFGDGSLKGQVARPAYIFILDASGSMWQKTGTDFKIKIAKDVLTGVISDLPNDAEIGLMAYGHNRKNDCHDIEWLVRPGIQDRPQIVEKIFQLDPKGHTPIANAVKLALETIRSMDKRVHMILISDGLETCEGDACELMGEAIREGHEIKMHVIGFGIDEENLASLECLAQAGGGLFIPAENTADLTLALRQTTREDTILEGGFLAMRVLKGSELTDASIRIFREGEIKEMAFGRTYAVNTTNPRLFHLPPGKYDVDITALFLDGKPVIRKVGLEITESDSLKEEIRFDFGNIQLLVTRNGALSDALISVYRKGTRELILNSRSYRQSTHNPVQLKLLPGTYDIELSSMEIANRPIRKFDSISLEGEGKLDFRVDFPSCDVSIGAGKTSGLVDATIAVIDKKSGQQIAAGRTYATPQNNPKTLVLEPGEYEIRLKPVDSKLIVKTADVIVHPGEKKDVNFKWE